VFGQQYQSISETRYGRLGSSFFSIRLQSFIAKLAASLVVVFVFEEAIYGRLSLTATTYLIAKTSTEALLYFFLLLVISHQLIKGQLFQYRPSFFDFCMVSFFIVALMATFINHGSLVMGIFNLRTMLRYIAIYYIIVLSDWMPTERQLRTFVKLLVWLALIQSFLITLQHFIGDDFREAYFSPPAVEVNVSGISKILGAVKTKIGAGYGTFGKPALASFFLLFVGVFVSARAISDLRNKRKWWVIYALIVVGIFFSYKRAPLLLSMIVPMLVAWFYGYKQFLKRYIILALVIAPLALTMILMFKPDDYVKEKKVYTSPIESVAQLFTEDYWAIALSKSRGWMIMEVGRDALVSFKPLGYGADEESAKAMLAERGGEFGKLMGWGAFEDVYIVACLVYYGPVGVVFLLLSYYYLYRRARKLSTIKSPWLRLICVSFSVIVILILPSVFVERLPEFRATALLFWTMAGIVVTVSQRYKKYGADSLRLKG